MTYQELFEQVKMKFRKADVSGVKEHLAFQFNITGEAAGSFYAEVRDGTGSSMWSPMSITIGMPRLPVRRTRFSNWRTGKWIRWPHLPWAGLRWTEISEKR